MADLILEIVEGGELGRQIDLDRPLEIGRDRAMAVPLPDDTQASRRHARVTPRNGGAVVEDLGSTNGTLVNDQSIHGQRLLRPGDHIRIGLTVLELRSRQQVELRPSAVRPRPQLTQLGEGVLAPVSDEELGGPTRAGADAPAAGPAPAGAAPPAAAPQPPPGAPRPPQPPPPLPGARAPAPAFQPGVGLRAASSPAAYVPAELVEDDEAVSDYGALARMVDVKVKQQRNIAAFAMLAAAGLAVLIYFGLQ